MPESKQRRKTRPPSRRRNKTAEARARATQAAQKEAEGKKISPMAYRRRRFIGWGLVGLGIAIGIEHFLEHLGLFNLFPILGELGLGWPMAGALGVAGAIVLSK